MKDTLFLAELLNLCLDYRPFFVAVNNNYSKKTIQFKL